MDYDYKFRDLLMCNKIKKILCFLTFFSLTFQNHFDKITNVFFFHFENDNGSFSTEKIFYFI